MRSLVVSHDDLHALLPPYAAGELDEASADAVRGHLAAGCLDCLHDLFARPVGRPPRAVSPVAPQQPPENAANAAPAVAGRAEVDTEQVTAPSSRRGRWGLVAVALLGLPLAALAVWNIYDLRLREVVQREHAARLARRLGEADATRAGLTARLETLGRELTAAREEAARQADAVRATAEESARLVAELEAAQERIEMLTRGVRRRDTEIDRMAARSDEAGIVRELLATPGVEMLRLRAVPPFGGVEGYVVWHPARQVMVLYAFDLPASREGTRYRVWLDLGIEREGRGPTFIPGPRGDVVLPLQIGTSAERLRGIQVVREPAAEPVLAAEVGRPAS